MTLYQKKGILSNLFVKLFVLSMKMKRRKDNIND